MLRIWGAFIQICQVIIIWLRAITHVVRAFRVPIAGAALLGVVLCLPQQMIEIYRALAEDLLYPNTRLLGSTLELASAILLCVLCVLSIWRTARAVALHGYADAPYLARPAFARLPKILAAAPLACMAAGVYRSTIITAENSGADQAFLRFFDETNTDVLELIKAKLLGYDRPLMISATAIMIVAAALVFLLPPLTERLAKHAAARLHPAALFSRPTRVICYGAAGALVLLVAVFRVAVPQAMGTLGILFAFAAIVTPILTHIASLSDRHRVPYLGILAGVVFAISALDLNDNHTLYRPPAAADAPVSAAPAAPPQAENAFRDWFQQRSDAGKYETAGRSYPVYVVASEGGGIYAAYHAASVLSDLQDRCPAFANHLFAISSVSGGSLGAATFAAGLKYAQAAEWPNANTSTCFEAEPPQRRDQSLADFSDTLLSKDFLSPLTAGLMFTDMLQGFLPWGVRSLDRTRNFEAAFEAALDQTIAEKQATGKQPVMVANFFRSPVLQHWRPSARAPALVMNTTEVGSGRVRVIAPFVFNPCHVLFLPFVDAALAAKARESLDDISISAAAITSARFPWVTPAGAFFDWSSPPQCGGSAPGRIEKIRLVDGGYFENSGVATAMELISSMQSAARTYGFADKVSIRLIVLTKGGFPQQGFFGLSELISPVLALLSARSSRAPLIIDQIARASDRPTKEAAPSISVSKVSLQDLYYPLPLGWRLSALSTILIQAQNGMPDRCKAADAGSPEASTFGADCLVKTVKQELN